MGKTVKLPPLKMVLAPGPSSAGDHLLERGPGANDKRECVVCLEALSAPVSHKHFGNCHGQQVCDGCVKKIDACPMCRIPKDFGAGTIINVDQSSGGCCIDSFGIENLEDFYDSGHSEADGESEAESLSSPGFFLFDNDDQIVPTPSTSTPPQAAQSSIATDLESILSDLYKDTNFDAAAGVDEDVKPVIKADRSKRAQKKSEPKTLKVQKSKICPVGKSKKNKDKAEIGADSPFASIGLTDTKVCAMPFQELIEAMNAAGFSKQQVAAGKLYRKRLKNRQHVMEYSSRKKQSTASIAEENKALKASIIALTAQNTELTNINKRLNLQVEEANKAQAQTRFEMSALQEQIVQLQRVVASLKA